MATIVDESHPLYNLAELIKNQGRVARKFLPHDKEAIANLEDNEENLEELLVCINFAMEKDIYGFKVNPPEDRMEALSTAKALVETIQLRVKNIHEKLVPYIEEEEAWRRSMQDSII